jgi:uncharacterized protein (TIGR03067 family)
MVHAPIPKSWCCIVVLLAGSFALAARSAEKAAAELEGGWRIVSIELEGEARPLEEEVRLVIQGEKVLYGDQTLAVATLYPDSTPKGIDLAFEEPKTQYEGIYAVEEDRLRICLNTRTMGVKERPSEFSTKEKPNLRIFTLQRLGTGEGLGRLRGFVGVALALENGQDVTVTMVLDKSPAEKAGLKQGDVILRVGNEKATDLQTTVDVCRAQTPGSELKIQVRRDGNEREIAVKVGAFPFSLLGLLG